MITIEMLKQKIFDEEFIKMLQKEFFDNVPIRHFVIESFLEESLANSLLQNFPTVEEMKTNYNEINEKNRNILISQFWTKASQGYAIPSASKNL